MLIWITALHCEAKPVIDFYQLKKSSTSQAFDSYVDQSSNPTMACVVTGPGKISCAAATAWIAARYQSAGLLSWINLGTCGGNLQIGDLYYAHKIIDDTSQRSYYPVQTFKNKVQGIVCRTLEAPSTSYKSNEVFDMEASAFFAIASRFSTTEFIHSLKIVSDNPENGFPSSKSIVSDLINDNFDPISRFGQQLISLSKTQNALRLDQASLEAWLKRTHFTQSQQHQLTSRLQYLLNRQWSNQDLLDKTIDLPSKTMLQRLDQLCNKDSANL